MPRTLPIVFSIAILIGFVRSAALAADANAADRPNILFILADDLGWGDLSCYGNKFLRTPNLDKLAGEGTLFTQFYVDAPVCSPSRCAFFTGQYPARHKIHGHYATHEQNAARGMSDWLDPKVPNLASLLKGAGYATSHVGKWHLGNDSGGPNQKEYGFDFVGSGEGGAGVNPKDPYYRAHSSELFVNETLKFIDDHKGTPFFAQLWTLVPHATLNPTPEQMKPFEKFGPSGAPHKGARTIFYASVSDLDTQIGRLLDGLKKRGLDRNTLVLFSSDNGPEDIFISNAGHSGVGSPGPFRGRKRSLYEGGVRLPFLVRWPGHVPAGRIDDTSVVAAVDFFPTICDITHLTPPAGHTLDGEDMLDVLTGASRPRKNPLMWEWRFNIAGHPWNISPQLASRQGDYKLLLNPDGSRVELYDIPKDPMQVNNLAEKHPDVVKALSEKVLAWKKTLPPGPTDPGAGDNTYTMPQPGRKLPAPAADRPNRKAKKASDSE